MRIVELNTELLDAFHRLFKDIVIFDFTDYKEETQNYFLNKLYSKESFENNKFRKVFICVDEIENVLGFIVGDTVFGGVGFITWLGVRKEAREQGIGRNLVKEYEKFAQKNGAHLLEAATFTRNVDYYKELGFEVIGERKIGYFGVQNIIVNKSIK